MISPDRTDVVIIEVEHDEYTAYSSIECNGVVYVDGDEYGNIPVGLHYESPDTPYRIDINFHDRMPRKGEIEHIYPQLCNEVREKFDRKVDKVMDLIQDADNPLEMLTNIDGENLDNHQL